MKNQNSRKRTIRPSKHLKRLVKPFPRYGKAINALVLFGVMIFLAGTITGTILHIQAINDSKHSFSNKSTGSDSSGTPTPTTNTPTPTTQPTQTTTPSTPSTTTTPKSVSSNSVSCQTKVIPYSTTTQYVPNEYNTYTYNEGGFNGSEMVCSDGSTEDVTPPDNKVIYVGAIDRAAQDLAAYNKINASCSENNPPAAQFYTCTQTDENFYTVYASQSSTAAENFLNTLP